MLSLASSFTSNSAAGTPATIDAKWLAWLRLVWVIAAVNAVAVFAWLIYLTRQFADSPPARIAAGLSALGWTSDTYFWFHAVLMALSFGCFFAVGILLYVMRPGDRMAWFASIFLIALGGEIAYPLAIEFTGTWATAPVLFAISYFVNNLFSWGFLGAFLTLFPDGRFVPGWSRFVALFGFLFSFGFGIFPAQFNSGEGWLFIPVLAGGLGLFLGSLYAQVWRYRHYSTSRQKQQTKWLIYALALIVLLVFIVSTVIYSLLPSRQVTPAAAITADLIYFLANLTFILLPLTIGIAIVRYRLWDIDVIIRKTLTYAIVAALLALIYFGSIILLQQLFATLTGQRNQVITVLSTLAIAALFVPLRNRIQAIVDRRFYRKKYDAQQVLSDFAGTVRDETDLERLTARLMQVVNDTMQPKSVSVWLADENLSDFEERPQA